jgi:hypothetical protein
MLDPQEQLARMYIEEFLRGKGYTFETVRQLPADQAKKIMAEASTYAACKLAEVERRAHIVEEIHGVSGS